VWGTTKSALYKYTYLPTYLSDGEKKFNDTFGRFDTVPATWHAVHADSAQTIRLTLDSGLLVVGLSLPLVWGIDNSAGGRPLSLFSEACRLLRLVLCRFAMLLTVLIQCGFTISLTETRVWCMNPASERATSVMFLLPLLSLLSSELHQYWLLVTGDDVFVWSHSTEIGRPGLAQPTPPTGAWRACYQYSVARRSASYTNRLRNWLVALHSF